MDARLTREFRALFEADGLDRRDWMILNAIAGTVDRGPVAARLQRGGRRLRAFVDRGWVDGSPGSWTLTDEGRMAFERLAAKVSEFRARVAGAVSPDDFATTLATLEAIAAELGEGDDDFGRRRGRRRGFGPGFGWGRDPRRFGRGFGPGFGPSHGHGVGPGSHGGEHGSDDRERHHPHHGHHHGHDRHHGHPHHGHGHGCGQWDPEFAHGEKESGRGHSHDRGSEGGIPATPTTEV
ncbi:hypothetical protein ACPW96_13190 [Micromonospora sp. DT81.3]|uniref:hypothetical protein n=1 Tax=Micromonospora sp. DT81.3 TaxID=3416523 RepID=UPI003CED0B8A